MQPDNSSLTVALLTNVAVTLQCVANGTSCPSLPPLPPSFRAPGNFKLINALWFTSLALSLSVSMMAILVKQWIHAYYSGLTGLPKTYARIRQFRYDGIQKWHMSGIISALPSVMYLAALLFFAGLLVLLHYLDSTIYYVCVAILVVTGIGHIGTTVFPMLDPSCPFQTPASQFVDQMTQVISYYMTRTWYIVIHRLLAILDSLWGLSYGSMLRIRQHLFKMYTSAELSLQQQLKMTIHLEREKQNIISQIPELDAHALVWLTSTYVQDTQEFVVQAIAGLTCETAVTHFNPKFNGSHWPGLSLVETFKNPELNPSYYHKLASYAQAYLITAQLDSDWMLDIETTQKVCNALQWYPVLLPMGKQAGPSAMPTEYCAEAISELSQALSIVTGVSGGKEKNQVILDLLLQSILRLYVLYSDNTTVKSYIYDSCFETIQIWMGEKDVLEQWPRPSFLLSLCSIVQVFTGITQPSALRIFGPMKDMIKRHGYCFSRVLYPYQVMRMTHLGSYRTSETGSYYIMLL